MLVVSEFSFSIVIACSSFIYVKSFESVKKCGSEVFQNYFFNFIYLVTPGLSCCTQAFSSCEQWGLFFVGVHGLLVVASLVESKRSKHVRFSSSNMRAQ